VLEFKEVFAFLLELLRIFVGIASHFCWFSLFSPSHFCWNWVSQTHYSSGFSACL